jgi:hypothetical protein
MAAQFFWISIGRPTTLTQRNANERIKVLCLGTKGFRVLLITRSDGGPKTNNCLHISAPGYARGKLRGTKQPDPLIVYRLAFSIAQTTASRHRYHRHLEQKVVDEYRCSNCGQSG